MCPVSVDNSSSLTRLHLTDANHTTALFMRKHLKVREIIWVFLNYGSYFFVNLLPFLVSIHADNVVVKKYVRLVGIVFHPLLKITI